MIADIRAALPGVGHQQLTEGLKTLARTDRRVLLAPWDNQKALTQAQKAAGFNFGGTTVHVVRINPPGRG